MKKNIFLTFALLLLIIYSCNTTDPKIEPELKLELKDIACTEAWLRLTTNNIQLPATINLFKNNSISQVFNINTKDSLLYIDSLLPNQTYKFKIVVNTTNNPQPTTNEVLAQTMDTTSHNFTFQTFTFGEHSSSTLYDVAIINENDIWAVGEIYMNDSLGNPDPTAYNAIHWNGNDWEIKRVQTLFRGNLITVPLEGVFAFSPTDIWMVGSLPIHGDGLNWTMYDLRSTVDPILSLSNAWGSNSNDMYFVGSSGSLAHYNGNSWTKLESGTTTNINDVWGINDINTNNSLVLCTVSSRFQIGDYKLLSISASKVNQYIIWPYTRLYGVWFNSPQNIYVVGDGAYVYKNNSLKTINLPTNYFLTRIKGNALNDIYISTSGAEIIHYNGSSWKEMSDGVYGKYEGMDVKGNIAVTAGYNIEGGIVGKAVITMGKHYN